MFGRTQSHDIFTLHPSGHYQQTLPSVVDPAQEDCFLLAFNTQDQLHWATYFGGGSDEVIYNTSPGGITAYNDSKLYLVGATGTSFSQQFTQSYFPLEDRGNGAWFSTAISGQWTEAFISELDISFITSVDELAIENFGTVVQLYPNPSTGDAWIKLTESYDYQQIEVLSMDGRVAYSNVLKLNTPVKLPLAALPSGVYIVRGKTAAASWTRKLILR